MQESVTPDWNRIAESAEVKNGELAKIVTQTVLTMALMKALEG